MIDFHFWVTPNDEEIAIISVATGESGSCPCRHQDSRIKPIRLDPILVLADVGGTPAEFNGSNMAERPPQVKAPAYLSPSPPVPEPDEAKAAEESGGPKGKEPTRYGDWENNGIAWDF